MLDHLLIHAVAGRGNVLGLAVLYEFRLDRFRVFGPADGSQLMQRLLQADWVSGYHPMGQDLPLIAGRTAAEFRSSGAYRTLGARCNDLCQRVSLALGRDPDTFLDVPLQWPLAEISRGTIEVNRAGTGLEASQHLQLGEWASAASYALDDAALIKTLVLFVERHGYVVHGQSGQKLGLRVASARSPLKDMDPMKAQVQEDFSS